MSKKRVNFKMVGFIVVVIAVIVGLGAILGPQVMKEMKGSQSDNTNVSSSTANKKTASSKETVKISIDEWIGYKSLLDANGGLKTKKGSINDNLGINVEYVLANDPDVSSAALIKGDLSGAGYTVNRYAFLQSKFKDANVNVVMPFITNYSNGGDGIVSKSDIAGIEGLAGRRIAVAQFSESHAMLEWLVKNSSLTEQQQKGIRDSLVFFNTPEDAGKAFFADQVDAAATWEPFLTQAKEKAGSKILFDTSMSTNLILSGMTFRQDFLDKNPEFLTKWIEGCLEASAMYTTDFNYIRAMPMFELMSDDEIVEMTLGAKLTTWKDNKDLLSDTAVLMYKDMANIWVSMGEKAYPDMANTAITCKYVDMLKDKYSNDSKQNVSNQKTFNTEEKEQVKAIDNKESLMSKRLDIKFQPDSTAISEESYPALAEFAETAKILDGVFIQIEGNTAKVSNSDGVEFSKKRANSIAKYLQSQGVDASRFIIVGNGDTNPIGDNNTEEGKAANRRTDIFFKVVGY